MAERVDNTNSPLLIYATTHNQLVLDSWVGNVLASILKNWCMMAPALIYIGLIVGLVKCQVWVLSTGNIKWILCIHHTFEFEEMWYEIFYYDVACHGQFDLCEVVVCCVCCLLLLDAWLAVDHHCIHFDNIDWRYCFDL